MASEQRPVSLSLGCRNCGQQLRVVGERFGSISVQGLRDLVYEHADGTRECFTRHRAEPYDNWNATRDYEAKRD